MKMNPYKGGRGQEAPYKTTHLRVPFPLVESFAEIARLYKVLCFSTTNEVRSHFLAALELFPSAFLQHRNGELKATDRILNHEYGHLKALLDSETAYNKVLQEAVDSSIDRINKANEILNHACSLKPNAGGAIKHAIREAQEYLK